MRYEVRGPAGNLIGLYSGPDTMDHKVRLLSQTPLMMSAVGRGDLTSPEESITVREIVLERSDVHLATGTIVPTLVLRSGKRSWLNDVTGFRRI